MLLNDSPSSVTPECPKYETDLREKNIRSTKVKESDTDTCKKSNEFYVKTIDLKGKIYTDQTGQFPVQ